ncbi:zinc finger protein 708 [Aedes albopictus]|uniref:C2h2-type zn-finger protein n=1 Tax=Aedes albopictus TaxID=7160 RepID=A0ABM1YWD7_AEDAL|nr:zinc finger protein 708-like isoform X3 [Aedes albopictus]
MDEEPNSLCRLCLSEETLTSSLRDENCYRWISDYLSIQVNSNDQMSQAICAICHLKLAEFHEFRIRCLEVQEVLQTRNETRSSQSTTEEVLEVLQIKCEKPSDQSTTEEVQEILQTKNEKPILKCEKCSRLFTSKKRLWNHMEWHKEQASERLQCEVCHKVFGTRTKFKDHEKYHKSMEKFVCTQCGKSYDRKVRLRNHMSICSLQMEKRLKNLEKSLSNNEEHTREVLLKMEAEETSSSVDVFPQSVVVKQEPDDLEEQ